MRHVRVLQSTKMRISVSGRIGYAKASPEGYKAFGGVYVAF